MQSKISSISKGFFEELEQFAKYLKGEIEAVEPLWQMIQTTEISFAVEENCL